MKSPLKFTVEHQPRYRVDLSRDPKYRITVEARGPQGPGGVTATSFIENPTLAQLITGVNPLFVNRATTTTLGGIKVGTGLTVDPDGTLHNAGAAIDPAELVSLETLITDETAARVAADASLSTAIAAGGGGDPAAIASLETALGSEATTRGAADTSLTTRIGNEETARTSAGTSLTTRVSTEESARTAAASSLTTRIGAEETARSTADTSLAARVSTLEAAGGGDVAAEAALRAAADTSLTTRLGSEESGRATGDASLSTRVSTEEGTRGAADTSLTTRLGSEESGRATAVTSLTARVSTEESARAAADTSEASTRGTADASLTTRLASEETTRSSAVSSLSTAATSEASTRSTADASLTTRLGTEEGARATGDTSLATVISAETLSRVAGDASLSTALSSEIGTRGTADASLTTRISAEESTRGTADSSLTTRISTEESVRASADTSLTTAVSGKQATLSNASTLAKITESAGNPLWNGSAWPGGGGGGAPLSDSDITGATSTSGTISGAQAKLAAQTWGLHPGTSSAKNAAMKTRGAAFEEDFVGFFNTTNGAVGLMAANASGSGAKIIDFYNGGISGSIQSADRPGIVILESGTTSAGYAQVAKGGRLVRSGSTFLVRFSVWLQNLSDATDAFWAVAGLGADGFFITADPIPTGTANVVELRYKHDNNSGRWEVRYHNGSTETLADTGVAVTAPAWYDIEFFHDGSAFTVSVNGTAVGPHSTNLPATFQGPKFGIRKTAGTNNRRGAIDHAAFYPSANR